MNELYHHGVKGQKWGVRRYQNKDGSLTKAGQKRYERDQRENAGKKKGNKVGQADPHRWVREDMERTKRVADSSNTLVNEFKNINRSSGKRKQKLDLSNMSDKEMRDKINRAILEKQYNDIYNPKVVSKGRVIAGKILDGVGSTLVITSSALGVALAVKELKG